MLQSAAMKHGTDAPAAAAPAAPRPLRYSYTVWIILSLAVALDLALGVWLFLYRSPASADPPGVQTFDRPQAAPDFRLTDQNGQPFTQADLRGHWTVLLFGYTHCPDFCPTTLAALNSFHHRLESDDPPLAADTRIAFVSVDPYRDTPPVLTSFITHFNPRFTAATGTPKELRQLTAPLGASYDYASPLTGEALSDGSRQPLQDYTVNHAAGLYVFDPQARNVAWVLPPHSAARLDAVYHFIRERYE